MGMRVPAANHLQRRMNAGINENRFVNFAKEKESIMGSIDIKEAIENGKTTMGIEFGSTRIKAVLITEDFVPVANGSHKWENRLENNIWTYSEITSLLTTVWRTVVR